MTIIMELGEMDLYEYWNKFVAENHGNRKKIFRETYKIIIEVLEAFVQLHHEGIYMYMLQEMFEIRPCKKLNKKVCRE